jgi:hypothetical protein
MLLTGVLVALPVEHAEADSLDLGPDGYFSALEDTDGDGQILPIVDNETGTPPLADDATGWVNTRRILFGKQKSTVAADPNSTYQSYKVSGGYKTLAKGPVGSENASSYGVQNHSEYTSATTSVGSNEALLWADDVVTSIFRFDSVGSSYSGTYRNSFEYAVSQYQSNLAKVADDKDSTNDVAGKNYSDIEKSSLRADIVEGVCVGPQANGCALASHIPNTYQIQSDSDYRYGAFPLSVGDMRKYLNHTQGPQKNANLMCPEGNYCLNTTTGYWLRSAVWTRERQAFGVYYNGELTYPNTDSTSFGLRPAVRLQLDRLVLSAHSVNQSQVLDDGDSLRLTFVDEGWTLEDSRLDVVPGELMVSADEDASIDGYGWKAVDRAATDGSVFASGFSEDGTIDTSVFPADKVFDFYVWGQENGSAETGWSNRATTASRVTIKDGKEYAPPSYGIELTGRSDGALTAYRIGDYAETVFTQTGALKSLRLDTPEGLGTVLKTAAETAGGSDVDVVNPIGWVASRWLGYPTDPLSDDVTSTFSPYAGQLQLFAQELAKDTGGLGAAAGSLARLDGGPETLKVSGPGLYLIVDSTQGSGGSLPIIVGTKVFNEALGDDGGFVDFVDAGVKGKPRLGQAALKTTVSDVAKRIVNDAGLDGFDVGSQVEYEIALRVPDLTLLDGSVSFDEYVFDVFDVVVSGLTLPVYGSGVEVFVDALSSTEPQSLPSSSVAVSGDTLTVDGLKSLFAESDGVSGVRNQDSVPAGSLMRVRYTAVLNASAVVSAPVEGESLKPNANTVTLNRSYTGSVTAGWADNSDGTESKSAKANAYTFKVDVVKLDKDDLSTRLGGVGFEVSRDGQTLWFEGSAGVYRLAASGEGGATQTVTTHTDGTLSLQGVEARELSFKETNAPSGYFKVSDFGVDIRPEWNEDATQVTKVTYATSGTNLAYVSKDGEQVVVLDPAWSLANLPYTGGVGILVLLIVGGLMLVFAVRPYVLSKRAERDANLV